VVGLGALEVERKVGVVEVEDPILVEVVSKLHVVPCLEEGASMSLVVEAFLQETHDQVALAVCLMVEVAWVASGGIQEGQEVVVAFLLVGVQVEGACSHPSCLEEEAQE